MSAASGMVSKRQFEVIINRLYGFVSIKPVENISSDGKRPPGLTEANDLSVNHASEMTGSW